MGIRGFIPGGSWWLGLAIKGLERLGKEERLEFVKPILLSKNWVLRLVGILPLLGVWETQQILLRRPRLGGLLLLGGLKLLWKD